MKSAELVEAEWQGEGELHGADMDTLNQGMIHG